jgi:uncharacterized protein YmfQ (DUF2313 family)
MLLDLLPDNYKKSEYVVDLQKAFGEVVGNLINDRDDFFSQLFIADATWGLTAWEKALGITTDQSKSYAFRRERIQAKLRGSGTTTMAMIKQVAAAYSYGDVEVIEDTSNYKFTVKFVGTLGIPENMSDLTLTIEEIKPAHLRCEFEYTYISWDKFENYNKTWNEWDVLELSWDEFEIYKEG